jgi:hypothetical protein
MMDRLVRQERHHLRGGHILPIVVIAGAVGVGADGFIDELPARLLERLESQLD